MKALGQGFEQGFQGGLEKQYAEAQKMRKASSLREALAKAETTFGNPDLTPEQKQVALYRDLAEHPEIAQQLGQQLPAVAKAAQPKPQKQPPISERAVPPEISKGIQDIISQKIP